MSKYIDAERLKAEIRRQKHELELSIQSQGDYGQSCHIVAYENIISLIDSLLQEQPEINLEKETKRWWKEHLHLNPENQLWMDSHQSVVFARHFFELGLNARKEG